MGAKTLPHQDSIPDRPARSQSLYRLSYPVHTHTHTYIWIYFFHDGTAISGSRPHTHTTLRRAPLDE